jgi:RNA polymerase sigma-70 factor (ECF subfamily)
MANNVPKEASGRLAKINGEPGFVGYVNGKPFSAITLDVRGGRIEGIYIVTNPEKLARLPNLPTAPI